jgi:hypothetical protein
MPYKWAPQAIVTFIVFICWCMFLGSIASCKFIKAKSGYYGYSFNIHYGIFKGGANGSCGSYTGGTDSAIQAAQAFAILCQLAQDFVLIILLAGLFIKLRPELWKAALLTTYAIIPMQLFVFGIFGTKACDIGIIDCKISSAGNTLAAHVFFWTGLAFLFYKMPVPEEPPFSFLDISQKLGDTGATAKPQTGDETLEEGKYKIVTTETFAADGTKTIKTEKIPL